jgi:F-type H+-transporting ATPase subunit epsilon
VLFVSFVVQIIDTMAKLKLEIITPERTLLQQDVDEVQIPSLNGEIGILPGHTPLISQLAASGLLKYRNEGKQGQMVVGKGFVEVNDDKVTLLASLAESPKEIDLEIARRELASAEQSLKLAERSTDVDVEDALAKQQLSVIRIQAASERGAE